jgi:hypothetical protein
MFCPLVILPPKENPRFRGGDLFSSSVAASDLVSSSRLMPAMAFTRIRTIKAAGTATSTNIGAILGE